MLGREWLGPIHHFDRKATARSKWFYQLRTGFLTILLIALALVELQYDDPRQGMVARQANTGSAFYGTIVSLGIAAAVLVGPAAVAGSICQERARGNFDLCLASGLSPFQIVFGKFLARLWPVLSVMAAALPIVAISSLLGGVDPTELFQSFLVCCVLAGASCALATTFALRTNKAHEALIATYVVLVGAILFLPLTFTICVQGFGLTAPKWLFLLLEANPIYVVTFELDSASFSSGLFPTPASLRLYSIAVMTAISLGLTAWSTVRLRANLARRGEVAANPRASTATPRRSAASERLLDEAPIEWRERKRRRGGGLRLVWTLFGFMSVASLGLVVAGAAASQDLGEFSLIVIWFQTVVALLLLASIAPTSMAEERTQGSLDVLVATPLSPREIVLGKWRANDRMLLLLLIAPTLVVALTSWIGPDTSVGTFVIAPTGAGAPGTAVTVAAPVQVAMTATSIGPFTAPTTVQFYATAPSTPLDTVEPPTDPVETLPFLAGAVVWTTMPEIQTLAGGVLVRNGDTFSYLPLPPPALFTPPAARASPRWLRLTAIFGLAAYMGSAGVFLTALGLALAVVVKRPGRAIVWCVSAAVLGSLAALVPYLLADGDGGRERDAFLTSLSPLTFPYSLVNAILGVEEQETRVVPGGLWRIVELFVETTPEFRGTTLGILAFTIAALIGAWISLRIAIAKLDVGLGRADVRPTPIPKRPAAIPFPAPQASG